jgi:hypothetical protein
MTPRILGVSRCRHGVAYAWHVEAEPDDPLPAVGVCPICDRHAEKLEDRRVQRGNDG